MSSFGLSGVPDVKLSHRIEKGDGSYGNVTYCFVEAVDPTGIVEDYDKKFGMQLWGKKNQVGLVVFKFEGRTKMWSKDSRLLPSYQRQGLGTQMYKYAQQVTGRKVVMSGDLTTAGEALWKSIKRDKSLGGLASGLLNARQKYFLSGDVWQGKTQLKRDVRLVLERQDGSRDSAFFLYFDIRPGHAFIGRVHEKTVAANTKWVEFKRDGYRVKVLRADLLEALGALA